MNHPNDYIKLNDNNTSRPIVGVYELSSILTNTSELLANTPNLNGIVKYLLINANTLLDILASFLSNLSRGAKMLAGIKIDSLLFNAFCKSTSLNLLNLV